MSKTNETGRAHGVVPLVFNSATLKTNGTENQDVNIARIAKATARQSKPLAGIDSKLEIKKVNLKKGNLKAKLVRIYQSTQTASHKNFMYVQPWATCKTKCP